MDFAKKNGDRRPEAASSDAALQRGEREMARWRWFLFALMARYEIGEAAFLRIPRSQCESSPGSENIGV